MTIPPTNRGQVRIEHDGKTYRASYKVEKGILTVSVGDRIISTPLRSMPPETLARMILREMVEDRND